MTVSESVVRTRFASVVAGIVVMFVSGLTGVPTRSGGTHVWDYLYLLKHIINKHERTQKVIKSGGYAASRTTERPQLIVARKLSNFFGIFKSYHKLAVVFGVCVCLEKGSI